MIRRRVIRNLAAAAYTMAVTSAVGRWAVYAAYLERGYEAAGGEYCLILIACWMAWKAINHLFDTLEDLEYEQNCKKRRSGETSRMHDNR